MLSNFNYKLNSRYYSNAVDKMFGIITLTDYTAFFIICNSLSNITTHHILSNRISDDRQPIIRVEQECGNNGYWSTANRDTPLVNRRRITLAVLKPRTLLPNMFICWLNRNQRLSLCYWWSNYNNIFKQILSLKSLSS